ncbi:MAG: T9SS type A sorting domain-containing protein [Cryomorphaceae bacterium]|nr:T9SS type A sorting domain-containing protein [Flavobacteriales bacterium]
MKKTLFLTAAMAVSMLFAEAQEAGKKASLNADGQIELRNYTIPASMLNSSREITILEGFPFGVPANSTFKNTRGLTLADLDNDGQEEVIFGADKTIYALKGDGNILWEKLLTGVITLPPAIADMNGDGNLEIVVNTVGLAALQSFGRVHLLDANGVEAEGWPINFNDQWMLNAPAVGDVDGDGIMEIVSTQRVVAGVGYIRVVKMDGEPLNEGWPIEISANPAFTPSIGDINGDGVVDVIAGTSSDGAVRAYDANGQLLEGFPQISASPSSLSYQSPLLVDITGDGKYEIVGSRHGENPEYFVIDADGEYLEGWPVEASGWTYSPPSIYDADGEGDYHIFMGNPNTSQESPLEVMFGFNSDGSDLPNFPIEKFGGNEGVITIADIDNNGVVDLIFTSNVFSDEGGFIHAYPMDGSGELDGFPLRTKGLTFLNSALLSDINNDGNFDLSALSYTQNFGAMPDSIFITAFDLGFEYIPENVYFNAYKGDNSRAGLIKSEDGDVVSTSQSRVQLLSIFPNPSAGVVQIVLPQTGMPDMQVQVFDLTGKRVLEKNVNAESGEMYALDVNRLQTGVYVVQITAGGLTYVNKLVKE